MGRVFKTRYFSRWLCKTDMTDTVLCIAVAEMEAGLIDAVLGGGVVKKRIALPGRGKRGSVRTLLATNYQSRWIFLFGFEKNERDNISFHDVVALKEFAAHWLCCTDADIAKALGAKKLEEICHDRV